MQALRGGVLVKLVITIPAYNEEKTISSVIKEIPQTINGADAIEIIVVDDGSRDGTVNEAKKAGVQEIVTHKANKGLGVKFRDGLDAALRRARTSSLIL